MNPNYNPNQPPQQPPYPPPYPYPPPPYYPQYPLPMPTRTSGMAIAGFVLSFFCGLLGLIFSVIGYNECQNSNGMVTGQGLAIAGIVISSLSMLFIFLAVLG